MSRLREQIEQLPREIAPERDLWPDIARRAKERRRAVWRTRSAAVVVSLAAAAAVALAVRSRPRPSARPAPSAAPAATEALATSPPLPGEAEYKSALEALEAELAVRSIEMPEGARAAVNADLRVIDEAIAATRAALVARPFDPELRAELDRAYEDKLDLLREATELLTGI
jgi:hypothetical protein